MTVEMFYLDVKLHDVINHCDVENIIYVLFGDLLKKKHLNSLHDCIISVNYRF